MPLPAAPSLALQAGFLILVLLLAIWWSTAAAKAYALPGNTWNPMAGTITFVIVLAIAGLLFGLSQQLWIHNFDSFPPPALRIFLLLVAITVVIAYSPVGRKLAQLPLTWLVGYQVFRIPVELLIHNAGLSGLAPMEMTFEGRNWDILTPVLAIVLWYLIRQGKASKKVI